MKAIEISAPGGPDVLRLVERPTPTPGPGELLVRVEAAGVNRPDILQRGDRPHVTVGRGGRSDRLLESGEAIGKIVLVP